MPDFYLAGKNESDEKHALKAGAGFFYTISLAAELQKVDWKGKKLMVAMSTDDPAPDCLYSLDLRRALANACKEVKFYFSPFLALREYKGVDPDIVLSDVNLLGMTGFEFIGKLKEQEAVKK